MSKNKSDDPQRALEAAKCLVLGSERFRVGMEKPFTFKTTRTDQQAVNYLNNNLENTMNLYVKFVAGTQSTSSFNLVCRRLCIMTRRPTNNPEDRTFKYKMDPQ